MAAEGVHLPEAVLGGDVALGDDEVVERGGADVGDAVGVALDGDGSGESGDGDGAVELGEGVVHGLAGAQWRAAKKARTSRDTTRDEDEMKKMVERGGRRLVADDAMEERVGVRFGVVGFMC